MNNLKIIITDIHCYEHYEIIAISLEIKWINRQIEIFIQRLMES